MEIYKDLSNPASQEFEKLLSSQLSKVQIEEGKINSSLVWSAFKAVPKNNADETKIELKYTNHPLLTLR